MNYKGNFKIIMLVHLVAILILGALFSIVAPVNAIVLKWIMAVLFVSFVLQLLVFTFKPKWFADKTTNQPE